MSAVSRGDDWRTPPAEGSLSADGERYRLRWWPTEGVTKSALFRVITDDRIAILQHVRTVILRQKGSTETQLEPEASLKDIPNPLLAMMRGSGVEPANSEQEASRA